MAVHVKLRLEGGSRSGPAAIETGALVNTGFESDRTELILPAAAAHLLGWWPQLPAGAREENYLAANRQPVSFFRVTRALRVCAIVLNRTLRWVRCDAIIAQRERTVLISDALASALHLVILDPKRGLWCFTDEMGKRRRSEGRQVW